jgi:hypothetical protein
MLLTIIIILLALWILGTIASYTLGGSLNILLALVIAIGLYRFIQGRRGSVL